MRLPQSDTSAGIKEEQKPVGPTVSSLKSSILKPALNQMIEKRNLFQVDIEKADSGKDILPDNDMEKLEITHLGLSLLGTATISGKEYAVIEDKKVKVQALYTLGDVVQEARIKEILRHKVVLYFQGRNQVLLMEEGRNNAPDILVDIPNVSPSPMPELKDLDDNNLPQFAPTLMRHINYRLHSTEGEPDGILIYGKPSSPVFKKTGLKNGDIIQQINGRPVSTDSDAARFFGELEVAEQSRLTLIRNGESEEVVYHLKENFEEGEEAEPQDNADE